MRKCRTGDFCSIAGDHELTLAALNIGDNFLTGGEHALTLADLNTGDNFFTGGARPWKTGEFFLTGVVHPLKSGEFFLAEGEFALLCPAFGFLVNCIRERGLNCPLPVLLPACMNWSLKESRPECAVKLFGAISTEPCSTGDDARLI